VILKTVPLPVLASILALAGAGIPSLDLLDLRLDLLGVYARKHLLGYSSGEY
jgi:hypothetical protein